MTKLTDTVSSLEDITMDHVKLVTKTIKILVAEAKAGNVEAQAGLQGIFELYDESLVW